MVIVLCPEVEALSGGRAAAVRVLLPWANFSASPPPRGGSWTSAPCCGPGL